MDNQPTQIQASKFNNQPILIVFLSVFLLVLMGFTTFMYLQNRLLSQEISQTKATPTITPSPTITPAQVVETPKPETQIVKDELGRYEVSIPVTWKVVEHGSSFQNSNDFLAPDGSSLQINILDSNTKSLSDFLAKQDLTDKTSWEGKSGKKVVSTSKTTVLKTPAIRREEDWSAAGFTVLSTYVLLNKTVYQFVVVPNSSSLKRIDAYSNFQMILDTFKLLSPASGYTCPAVEWVDCMPSGSGPKNPQCSQGYLSWATANCSGFKGAAL